MIKSMSSKRCSTAGSLEELLDLAKVRLADLLEARLEMQLLLLEHQLHRHGRQVLVQRLQPLAVLVLERLIKLYRKLKAVENSGMLKNRS